MKSSYYKYFAALLLFGSNGIVASNINLPSYEIVLLRLLLGSLFLITVFTVSRQRFTFTGISTLAFIFSFRRQLWEQAGCCFTKPISRSGSA